MKRKNLLFLILCSLFVNTAWAQGRSVGGHVLDENGQALVGATVLVQGTQNGTATDADGSFQLNVDDGVVTLVIRAIGYTDQTVTAAEGMTIRMRPNATQLRGTIVTALGIRRNRNDLAYSAQKVDGADITKTRQSNFINSLSGRVAGLEIRQTNVMGGSTNVVLRGTKSLLGDNQALFVVDGVPINNTNTNTVDQVRGLAGYDFGNAAADIDPDMIESISVLKGAAATALYGSRAANGVILITTKKGTKEGFSITVNSGFTTGRMDKSTWMHYQKEYGAGYGQYYESPDGYFLYRDVLGTGNFDLVVPTSEDASFGAHFDPTLMVYDWRSFDPTSPNYHKQTPWVAAANDPTSFFINPFSANNNISISAGNSKGSFTVGYTRTIDKGSLENSRIVKNLFSYGASYNLSDRLNVSFTGQLGDVSGRGRYGTGYSGYNASIAGNFRQWWQMNTDVQDLRDAYFRNRTNNTWNLTDPDDRSPIYWDNPYWTAYENYETDDRLRSLNVLSLNYKVTDWFTIMGRAGLDAYREQQDERNALTSVGVSSYSRYNHNFNESNFDLIGNFQKQLAKNLNFTGLIGGSIRRTHNNSIYAITNGGLVIPHLYALSNSVSPIKAPVETEDTLIVGGVYGDASFVWRSMLSLELTLRRDQSSSLPEGNNVYYYPSINLGFVFSELIPKSDIFSYGKFRANYAEVGNGAPAQRLTDVYTQNTPFHGEPSFSVSVTKYNPDLRPERTKGFETGLELAFWRNRAGLDFTYYNSRSVDQIFPLAISRATGYDAYYINSGTVRNHGIELSLFVTPVKTHDFSWTLTMNYAHNRNEVEDIFPGVDNLQLQDYQATTLNAALHEPYGTIRGTDYVFDTHGNRVIDATGHYEITSTSNNIIGNVNPEWTGGILNSLTYRNLSLTFLIDIKKGGSVFSLDRYYGLATGLPEETAGLNELGNPKRDDPANGGGILLQGVMEDGTPNTTRIPVEYGTYGYVYNPMSAFVYDASYTKLRELTLTYSLPAKWIAKVKYIKGIDVSFIGRNLWIIHKNLPDADPEDGLGSGNIQGFQTGSFPTYRTFGGNIKFTF